MRRSLGLLVACRRLLVGAVLVGSAPVVAQPAKPTVPSPTEPPPLKPVKPEKPESKPEAPSTTKATDAKTGKADTSSTAKADTKASAKTEAKTEAKAEPKSDAKGDTPVATLPAQPLATAVAKVDPFADVPERCEPHRKRDHDSRIALAGCLADVRLEPLQLADTSESLLAVEAALEPSMVLLDAVITRSDAQHRLLARHAKLRVLQQATQRLLASVPADATARRELFTLQLAPWYAQISDEARSVLAIARAAPRIAKQKRVVAAVRDSKQAIAASQLATAPRPKAAASAP